MQSKPKLFLLFILSLLLFTAQAQAGRCQAITKKGTQCKRQAIEGSIYCWQHARMYDDAKSTTPETKKSETPKTTTIKPQAKTVQPETDHATPARGKTVIGTTATGKTLYQGSRGGVYHYSPSGKKVYQKRKK